MERKLQDEARELFLSEDNYNNGDVSSGQYIESEEEIYERLIKDSNKYVFSFSGGKDSTAALYLSVKNNYRIDEVICAVLPFEEEDMHQHLKNVDEWYFKETGKRTTFLRNENNIEDFMAERTKRGAHKGTIRGFPLAYAGFCWISRDWKINIMNKWKKEYQKENNCNVVFYLGFATDEKNPLRQLKIKNYKENNLKFSKELRGGKIMNYDITGESYPLVDFGYTEEMCRAKIEEIGLYCDTHFDFNRSGCWFCPKQGKESRIKAICKSKERVDTIEKYCKISGREIYPDLTLDEIKESL